MMKGFGNFKWKEYLKKLLNSEVEAKRQNKLFFHLVKIIYFRQLMLSLSNETENPFFLFISHCFTWPNFGHCRERSLTNLMLITAFT